MEVLCESSEISSNVSRKNDLVDDRRFVPSLVHERCSHLLTSISAVVMFFFFTKSPRFTTQSTWLQIDKVTPHQCWNVCDLGNYEKSGTTNLPTVAITPSKSSTHALLNLLSHSHEQRWHKGRDRTPTFQKHTMFK